MTLAFIAGFIVGVVVLIGISCLIVGGRAEKNWIETGHLEVYDDVTEFKREDWEQVTKKIDDMRERNKKEV